MESSIQKMKYYLLLIVFLVGCSNYKERNERDIEDMPAVFQPYVRQFLADAESYGHKIKLKRLRIEFSEDVLYSDGIRCNGVYYHNGHKILIWKNGNYWQKSPKALLYHELGHALLDRDHRDEVDKHHQPKSIMYRTGISDYGLENRTEYYLSELFN